MFRIGLKSEAVRDLKRIKRHHAAAILDAIERHLADEPERVTGRTIKRLRGRQRAVFRLRVADYRVFYDVVEDQVEIVRILHKSETKSFYEEVRR